MEGERLLNELTEQLNRYGVLNCNMRKMNNEEFWKFWRANGMPNVYIVSGLPNAAKYIPSDAVITVFEDAYSAELLRNVDHVENATFCCLRDYEVDGYVGRAKIDTIILTEPLRCKALPECFAYKIFSATNLIGLGIFDCNKKELHIGDIVYSREGLYREISEHFTNFCEVAISVHLFPQLYEEASKLATNTDILLSVRDIYHVFNLELLAKKFIAKLELCGHIDNINPDYFVDLRVGVIVEYDKCFESLVKMAITRLKKTKRCIS